MRSGVSVRRGSVRTTVRKRARDALADGGRCHPRPERVAKRLLAQRVKLGQLRGQIVQLGPDRSGRAALLGRHLIGRLRVEAVVQLRHEPVAEPGDLGLAQRRDAGDLGGRRRVLGQKRAVPLGHLEAAFAGGGHGSCLTSHCSDDCGTCQLYRSIPAALAASLLVSLRISATSARAETTLRVDGRPSSRVAMSLRSWLTLEILDKNFVFESGFFGSMTGSVARSSLAESRSRTACAPAGLTV